MKKIFIKDAPSPFRELFFLFICSIVASTVLTFLTDGPAVRVATAIMGAFGLLVGLTLIVNMNGAVDYYSQALKTEKYLGVDYSESIFARPFFVRVSGIVLAVLGLMFIFAGAAGPV